AVLCFSKRRTTLHLRKDAAKPLATGAIALVVRSDEITGSAVGFYGHGSASFRRERSGGSDQAFSPGRGAACKHAGKLGAATGSPARKPDRAAVCQGSAGLEREGACSAISQPRGGQAAGL